MATKNFNLGNDSNNVNLTVTGTITVADNSANTNLQNYQVRNEGLFSEEQTTNIPVGTIAWHYE